MINHKTLSICLPPDLLAQLDAHCAKIGATRSKLLALLIKRELDNA